MFEVRQGQKWLFFLFVSFVALKVSWSEEFIWVTTLAQYWLLRLVLFWLMLCFNSAEFY